MRVVFLYILVSQLLVIKVFSQAKTIIYNKTYFNGRFGYCIDYPNVLLKPQPEAQNGDGRIFTDKKGKEILRVYGARNYDIESNNSIPLIKLYESELNGDLFHEHPNRIITYSFIGKKFYVISGTENGNIFYQKTIQFTEDNEDILA